MTRLPMPLVLALCALCALAASVTVMWEHNRRYVMVPKDLVPGYTWYKDTVEYGVVRINYGRGR